MFKIKIDIEASNLEENVKIGNFKGKTIYAPCQVAIAKYTTEWITNKNIIIGFFNKEFFELTKKYDETGASGQNIMEDNDKNEYRSYWVLSKTIDIFIAYLEKQFTKHFKDEEYKNLNETIKEIRKFLIENKEKCEEFMISFTPDTTEKLAYEYSDKLNLKG